MSSGPAPTHLQRLEAEAIHILREVVAQAARPVMLYSMGKDSTAMLHLARKAFHPSPPPFPLLHVDTGWKFAEMIMARDRLAAEAGIRMIVHRNQDAEARGINPFDHGALHTDLWKTQGLRQALDAHGFDAAFGGARRDEERVRAKERVFSFRDANHRWDPRRQRPELWHLYNARTNPGETMRVFPLSNWTELDVWHYVAANDLVVSSLYLAAVRPTYVRDGRLFMADDPDRLERVLGHLPDIAPRRIRFRTLGCAPLTAAIESEAATLAEVIAETARAATSERGGRLIDADGGMERKKREGYF